MRVLNAARPLVAVIVGTRPEAIKMAPVIAALRTAPQLDVIVCTTGQHRDLIAPALAFFGIAPDERFEAMAASATLGELSGRLLVGLEAILARRQPALALVHGDTATTLAAALAASFTRTPVGHVEAGLRSHDRMAPWPEEINRRLTSGIADLHFAPTPRAHDNLVAEGIAPGDIFVTGNTGIDALRLAGVRCAGADSSALHARFPFLDRGRRLILVTGHRRENFGSGLASICAALRRLADRGDIDILYPVHPNPGVNEPVREQLVGHPCIHLSPPLDYPEFVAVLQRCCLVMTDSGGVQEEAPAFGKPVLVLRDTTERPEAIEAGVAQLVGSDAAAIVAAASRLLDDSAAYRAMALVALPFGDGHAADRIVAAIVARLPMLRGGKARAATSPRAGQLG